jgi:bifunctional pyridoxal-dependent enzyme with beta-cystathionase and maltose regulon repressor activities
LEDVELHLGILTTHVLSQLHLEVTVFTPVGSPLVLDEPIRDAILHTVANSKNSVVHILVNSDKLTFSEQ